MFGAARLRRNGGRLQTDTRPDHGAPRPCPVGLRWPTRGPLECVTRCTAGSGTEETLVDAKACWRTLRTGLTLREWPPRALESLHRSVRWPLVRPPSKRNALSLTPAASRTRSCPGWASITTMWGQRDTAPAEGSRHRIARSGRRVFRERPGRTRSSTRRRRAGWKPAPQTARALTPSRRPQREGMPTVVNPSLPTRPTPEHYRQSACPLWRSHPWLLTKLFGVCSPSRTRWKPTPQRARLAYLQSGASWHASEAARRLTYARVEQQRVTR